MPDEKTAPRAPSVEVLTPSEQDQPRTRFDFELGPPFSLSHDCDLLDVAAHEGVPGSFASIRCGACGTRFRANLLDDEAKECPGCHAAYTHVLMFCRTDDQDIAAEFIEEVLAAHGIETTREGGDDQAGDDEADEEGEADDDDASGANAT